MTFSLYLSMFPATLYARYDFLARNEVLGWFLTSVPVPEPSHSVFLFLFPMFYSTLSPLLASHEELGRWFFFFSLCCFSLVRVR